MEKASDDLSFNNISEINIQFHHDLQHTNSQNSHIHQSPKNDLFSLESNHRVKEPQFFTFVNRKPKIKDQAFKKYIFDSEQSNQIESNRKFFQISKEMVITHPRNTNHSLFGNDNFTNLLNFIEKGEIEKVEHILKLDSENLLSGCKDMNGDTPIHYASKYFEFPAMVKLIAQKSNLQIVDNRGHTALVAAILHQKFVNAKIIYQIQFKIKMTETDFLLYSELISSLINDFNYTADLSHPLKIISQIHSNLSFLSRLRFKSSNLQFQQNWIHLFTNEVKISKEQGFWSYNISFLQNLLSQLFASQMEHFCIHYFRVINTIGNKLFGLSLLLSIIPVLFVSLGILLYLWLSSSESIMIVLQALIAVFFELVILSICRHLSRVTFKIFHSSLEQIHRFNKENNSCKSLNSHFTFESTDNLSWNQLFCLILRDSTHYFEFLIWPIGLMIIINESSSSILGFFWIFQTILLIGGEYFLMLIFLAVHQGNRKSCFLSVWIAMITNCELGVRIVSNIVFKAKEKEDVSNSIKQLSVKFKLIWFIFFQIPICILYSIGLSQNSTSNFKIIFLGCIFSFLILIFQFFQFLHFWVNSIKRRASIKQTNELSRILTLREPTLQKSDLVRAYLQIGNLMQSRFKDTPLLKGSFYFNLGNKYQKANQYKNAESAYQLSLFIRKNIIGNCSLKVSQTYFTLGTLLKKQKRFQEALAMLKSALNTQVFYYGNFHPAFLKIIQSIAFTYLEIENYQLAKNYFEHLLNLSRIYNGENHLLTISCYKSLGNIFTFCNNYNNSIQMYLNLYKLLNNSTSNLHAELFQCINSLAKLYIECEKYQLALNLYKEANQIAKIIHSPSHFEVANSLYNLGLAEFGLGNYEEALKYNFEALNIRISYFGEESEDVSFSFNNIGFIFRIMGQLDNALKYSQKSLMIKLKIFGKDHLYSALSYNNIAEIFILQKRFKEALHYLRNALKIRESAGEDPKEIAITYYNLGEVHYHLKNFEKAHKFYSQSFKIRKIHLSENHPKTIDVQSKIQKIHQLHKHAISPEKSEVNFTFVKNFEKSQLMDDS